MAEARPHPISEPLWELTSRALLAARDAGRRHLANGRYVSRQVLPVYGETSSGWPSCVIPLGLGPDRSAPPDWEAMFGLGEESGRAMGVAEVPDLRTALDGVTELALADPEIEATVSAISYLWPDNPDVRRDQIQREFLGWLGTILNRSEATATGSLDELQSIYLETERGRSLPNLPGDLVVPLVMAAFPTNLDVVRLSDAVSIERLDEATQRARAPISGLSPGRNPYHRSAATHAVVVKDVRVPNLFRRPLRRDLVQLDLSAVDTVVEVLSLLSDDYQVGYYDLYLRPHGWARNWTGDLPPLERVGELDRLPNPGHAVWQDPKHEYAQEVVARLPAAFERLTCAEDKVRIASRRVVGATLRQEQEDAFLDSMIGIEALLGREKDEITHRLALRSAAALAKTWQPADVYGLVKFLYGQRSAIVHGFGKLKPSYDFCGGTYETVELGPWLLRTLFVNWLESSGPWSPQSLDQQVLGSLTGIREQVEEDHQ